MTTRAINQELSAACRLPSPDSNAIKRLITELKEKNVLTPSTVAHCLITILASRKSRNTRANFKAVNSAVSFLLEEDPKCLREIVQLNHSAKMPSELKRKQSIETSNDLELQSVKSLAVAQHNAHKLTRTLSPANKQGPLRKRFDSNSLMKQSSGRKGSRNVRGKGTRRPSVRSTAYQIQHVKDTLSRNDRFASVTSFEAEFDTGNSVATKKKVSHPDNTFKSFAFTPIYSLFESLSCRPADARELELSSKKRGSFRKRESPDISDLEADLVRIICLKYGEHADVNFMLSVRIASEIRIDEFSEDLRTNTELCSYQPVWHRLVNHGRFSALSMILDRLEVDSRKTMFEVHYVEDTSIDNNGCVSFGIPERGLATTIEEPTAAHRKEKFIISSKTALHEICSWSKNKWRELKSKGVTEEEVLQFVEKLIEAGADVNAVCMRREQRSKTVRDLVRKYKGDKKFRIKKLPGKDVSFFVWQTPLSLAIRARNEKLVRLLARNKAKMEYGDVFYPRTAGIRFEVENFEDEESSEDEDLGFKLAADLEKVPTVYSLNEVYFKVLEFETNFQDWKFVIDNEKLFEQQFKSL